MLLAFSGGPGVSLTLPGIDAVPRERPVAALVWPWQAETAPRSDLTRTTDPETAGSAGPLRAPDLLGDAAKPFIETRTARLAALADAAPQDRAARLVDLARLYLSHGLLREARGHLDAARAGSDGAELPSAVALRAVLGALGADPQPVAAASMADWPAGPALIAGAALRGAEDSTAKLPALDAVVTALEHLPPELAAQLAPALLDHAVKAADWRAARDLAALFPGLPGLRDSPAYHYLLGRTAEAGDEFVAAFDSYRRAAIGRDDWAQRSRLAILALARRTETLEPQESRRLAEAARRNWSGGPLGLQTLEVLAEAHLAGGERVAALAVLHDIAALHPQSLAAQKAHQTAETLLAGIYAEGTEGTLPLAAFMQAHQSIARDYRMWPAFQPHAEAYAAAMRGRGFTAVAAEEYAAIRDHRAVARDLGIMPDAPDLEDRLRLDEAEALMAGGQHAAAAELLAPDLRAADPGTESRRRALRAEAFEAMGDYDALIAEPLPDPAPRLLALRADALFSRADWAAALDAYAALFAAIGDAMAPAQATRYLLAAHRDGRRAEVTRLIATLPGLDRSPDWAVTARELAADRPDLLPLRRDAIDSELADAGRTAERIDTLSEGRE